MKIKRNLIVCVLAASVIWASGKSLCGSITSPRNVGFLVIGTRQDAAQLPGSGLGAGSEVFIRYGLKNKFSLAGALGILGVTDDVLRTERRKLIMLPSLEFRTEYLIIKAPWFRPFLYSGIQFNGAYTKITDAAGVENSSYDYQWNWLAGLGAEFSLGSPKYTLYMSGDYRTALSTTIDPKPKYWVMKAGINLDLRNMNLAYEEQPDAIEAHALSELFTMEDQRFEASETAPSFASDDIPIDDKINHLQYEFLNHLQNMQEFIDSNSEHISQLTQFLAQKDLIDADALKVKRQYTSYKEAYAAGLNKFNAMEYEESKKIFEDLLRRNPNHELASNCHYWIGENEHALGNYQDAIKAFDHVLEYNDSHKFDDALLMKGQIYIYLDQKGVASDTFQQLLQRFPDSEFVTLARRYLRIL